MWDLFKRLRLYDPVLTGFLDMQIVAFVLAVMGILLSDGDPAGIVFACYLGIGVLLAIPVADLYICRKRDWLDVCPYTAQQICSWKTVGYMLMVDQPKGIDWTTFHENAAVLQRIDPEITPEFALAAIIHGYVSRTGTQWLPKEAQRFRTDHPKTYHIVGWV